MAVRAGHVAIVGGGVIGLLTAMECVLAGARVTLVDGGEIPSPVATSHDTQRVVRALHRGDAGLTAAAAHAHRAWQEVERRLGTRFYHQVGALTALPAGQVRANLGQLAAAGVAAEPLTPAALARRYPAIRFPAGLTGILEPAAGVVRADQALAALADWLRGQPGVELRPRRRAVAVRDTGVRLADRSYVASDRVVVAAGPWSRDLLPDALGARLTLFRQTMLSYSAPAGGPEWAGVPAIPALGTPNGAWLIPSVAGTPVRLSAASACRPVAALTDRAAPGRWASHLVDHFGALLAGFDPAGVTGAADGYYLADASSGGPLLAGLAGLDRRGNAGPGRVWAYAACGGMSFKFAPLIARALADRATGRPPRRTGLGPVDQPECR